MTDGEFAISGMDLENNDATATLVLGALILLGGALSFSPARQWPLGLTPLPAGVAIWVALGAWLDIEENPLAGLEAAPVIDQDAAWGLVVVLLAAVAVIVAVFLRVTSVLFASGEGAENDPEDGNPDE